jgi:hypothetical protein
VGHYNQLGRGEQNFCKALQRKTLLSALYSTYTVTLNELKSLLKASSQQGDDFKEVRNRKRHSSQEATNTPKKATLPTPSGKVATRNFFAPLRTANMDTDPPAAEPSSAAQETVPGKTGRPPAIILTSVTNLMQLQKQLEGVAKQAFEFRNTKTGTRVITKDMIDFQAVKLHFESNNLSFRAFPKSDKRIKAVIRDLPNNTPAEDIAEGLGNRCQRHVGPRKEHQLTSPWSLSHFLGPTNPKKYSNCPASATSPSR